MALSAETAGDRVEQLILLTERLTALVALEAQAFENRRPQDAALHVGETSRLANIYRHESAKVRANPGMVAAATLAQRTRLIRATEAFDAVLARQGRALEAAKTVTEGLVRAIAEEVANQRQKGVSYDADGITAVAGTTAITLNQRA
jgi:hypothetical protein